MISPLKDHIYIQINQMRADSDIYVKQPVCSVSVCLNSNTVWAMWKKEVMKEVKDWEKQHQSRQAV
jgi:hypothetical protein